ncbi:hypothetical protein M8J77_001774 [Diaphorina citri]|nr:hypothetical protein M8J77_001774 [Diaphorina citri]
MTTIRALFNKSEVLLCHLPTQDTKAIEYSTTVTKFPFVYENLFVEYITLIAACSSCDKRNQHKTGKS